MVETRIARRHRVMKPGTIEFGSSAIDCMVRNLSITRAALEVSNQIGIPAKFTLVVPGDGLHLACNVVWRSEYRIGAAVPGTLFARGALRLFRSSFARFTF